MTFTEWLRKGCPSRSEDTMPPVIRLSDRAEGWPLGHRADVRCDLHKIRHALRNAACAAVMQLDSLGLCAEGDELRDVFSDMIADTLDSYIAAVEGVMVDKGEPLGSPILTAAE